VSEVLCSDGYDAAWRSNEIRVLLQASGVTSGIWSVGHSRQASQHVPKIGVGIQGATAATFNHRPCVGPHFYDGTSALNILANRGNAAPGQK
jgi:hypothetical protein